MAIRRGSSRFVHARRGTGRDVSEGEPSAAEVPDGRVVQASPAVFGRPVEDAWRRSKLMSASSRASVGCARRRASPEVFLRSSRPGERCSTLRTYSRRGVALRPSGSARCGESGARSNAALRVWDGPSGFLWRESREKPDSDSDYGFIHPDLGASGRFCLLRCGIPVALVRWCDPRRKEAASVHHVGAGSQRELVRLC